jgi:hypothetical protein
VPDGFDWQGTSYPSLSAIARATVPGLSRRRGAPPCRANRTRTSGFPGTAWSGPRFFALTWRPVEADALEKLIKELPNKPFLVGEEGVSMSLAGVQTKLPVAVDDASRICIPMNGSPSTHILKPDTPRLRGSIQNEAFCLTLASV